MATNYFYALGRRKSATARVRLSNGKGKFIINSKDHVEYVKNSKYLIYELNKPFATLELTSSKFDISAVVAGGGISGQIDAIQLGIAKALTVMNEDLKGSLRKADLLGRDPREKERKKFGLKSARKQRQFTKR